jgi:hypothetical protein
VDFPTIQAGDLFCDPAQPLVPPQRIASVDYTAVTATLAVNWPGTTMTAAAYEVRYVGDAVRSTAQTREVLTELSTVQANGRGLFYVFDDSTTDSDPGTGKFRFNNATIGSATAAYLDNLDADGATVSAILDTWDDIGDATHGQLWVRSISAPSTFAAFELTGSVVDGTGYRKLTLAYIGGSGSLATGDDIMLMFSPVGVTGVDGTSLMTRVRTVSTSNITISTALNSGDTIDGVTLATNDLVLVAAQTTASDNGVYVVGASPARATAFSTYDAHAGAYFSVMEGTVNADTLWRCTSNKGGTLGTDALAFSQYLPGLQSVASRTALKALDTTAVTTTYLTESGREGEFVWRSGDYSALITADTQEAVYIKATAVASTSGSWVRVYAGALNVKWFGAKGDGTTDDATPMQAAIDLVYALGGGSVFLPPGEYLISSQIGIAVAAGINCKIFGAGQNATKITIDSSLDTSAGAIAIGVATSVGGCGVSVFDLTIAGGATKKAIVLTNANIFKAERVDFSGVGIGVVSTTSYFVQLVGCSFINCAIYGFVADSGVNGLHIERCGFYGIGGQAILLDGATQSYNVKIVFNDFEDVVTVMQFNPGVDGLLFEGNWVEEASGALWSFGAASTGVIIEGNTLQSSATTSLDNVSGGRFAANNLYNQVITAGTAINFIDGGGNAALGTSTLPNLPRAIGGDLGSADNRVLRSDGTGGKTAQASGVTIDDADTLTAGTLVASKTGGTVSALINAATSGQNAALTFLSGGASKWDMGKDASDNFFYYDDVGARNVLTITAGANGDMTLMPSNGNVVSPGAIRSTGPTKGVGYATGAGGTVTQATSKSTGVTLSKVCGQITMNAAALAAGAKVSFVVTNTAVAASDMVVVNVVGGGTANAYRASVAAVGSGSFTITVENITGGSLSEAAVIGFAIIKAVTA